MMLYPFNDAYIELIKKFISLLTIFSLSRLNGIKKLRRAIDLKANRIS